MAPPGNDNVAKQRIDAIERELNALRADVSKSLDKFEATLGAAMTSFAARLERVITVEGKYDALSADVNRAHEKLRTLDVSMSAMQGMVTQVQTVMQLISTELPKISGSLNGEHGLVAQLVLLKDRVSAHSKIMWLALTTGVGGFGFAIKAAFFP